MFWNNENKSKLWHKTEDKSWIHQVEVMNSLNGSHELTGWETYGIIPRKFIIQTNQIEMIDLNDIVNVTIWQTLFLTARYSHYEKRSIFFFKTELFSSELVSLDLNQAIAWLKFRPKLMCVLKNTVHKKCWALMMRWKNNARKKLLNDLWPKNDQINYLSIKINEHYKKWCRKTAHLMTAEHFLTALMPVQEKRKT